MNNICFLLSCMHALGKTKPIWDWLEWKCTFTVKNTSHSHSFFKKQKPYFFTLLINFTMYLQITWVSVWIQRVTHYVSTSLVRWYANALEDSNLTRQRRRAWVNTKQHLKVLLVFRVYRTLVRRPSSIARNHVHFHVVWLYM